MILHFIEDMGVTQYQLAKNAGVAHSRLTDMLAKAREKDGERIQAEVVRLAS